FLASTALLGRTLSASGARPSYRPANPVTGPGVHTPAHLVPLPAAWHTTTPSQKARFMTRRVRTAVLPVAGLGTRFLPATKVMPKEMLPVVDEPIIQYAIEEARAAGIERFVFVNGRGKGMLEDHFDMAYELEATLQARSKTDLLGVSKEATLPPGAISSVRQQEPLGLGHAVWCARELVGDEPFAVMLPDELTISDPSCMAGLIAAHEKTGGNV